jgi:serine phosphatase RsbU (regulator of sigma subunit)
MSDLLNHLLSLKSYTLGEPVRFESGDEAWWGMANEVENTVVEAAVTSQPVWLGAVIPESDLLARIPNLVPWMLVATVLVLVLAIFRAVRLAGAVSQPVEQLVEQSRRMQRLDFSREETVRSDVIEIGILAGTLDSMRRAMQAHTAESEQKRITDAILRNTLPRSLPVPRGYRVDVLRLPTEERGGDLVDVMGVANEGSLEPDGLALLVLVPEGDGVEAAVISVELRASFRTGVRAGLAPGLLADHLDQNLREDLESVQTVRAWFGTLDARSNRLLGLPVGVESVLHYRARESRSVRLPTTDFALGRGERPTLAQAHEIDLAPGDVVAVVTRGVVDALSAARERFGIDRVEACIASHHTADTPAIIDRLKQAIEEFCAGARATEDKTITLIKRLTDDECP